MILADILQTGESRKSNQRVGNNQLKLFIMKNFNFLFVMMSFCSVLMFTSCETDPCDAVVCLNEGTCDEGICACADGYEGTLCDTEWRTKMLGSYTLNTACGSGNWGPYSSTVTNHATDNLKVLFGYPNGSSVIYVEGTMTSENAFDIPSQKPCSNCLTLEGSGTINAQGTIILTSALSNGDNCVDTFTPS